MDSSNISNSSSSFFNNPDGLGGLFSIVLTATILTVFEIVFFYVVIAPDIENIMNGHLTSIADSIANSITSKATTQAPPTPQQQTGVSNTNMQKSINTHLAQSLSKVDAFLNIFRTFDIREEKLVNRINNYTVITGVVIIGSLVSLMVWLAKALQPMGGVTKESVISALLTVAVLVAFQGYFYMFGKEYKYPGSDGQEELLALIGSNIHSNI